ncbi:hypothetical protein [Wocania ichthyoenteri]|uniref:hypothetical protein n=1 Tax=Wocania ichthyoenteri TaxID=1230531 RepID=UPI00053EFB7A|nr:hypothetical protein [Wocania ichthyoenteri]
MSTSSSENTSKLFESCEEVVTTIYEYTNECGNLMGFYYIQNSGGNCGFNHFVTIDAPCKEPPPPPGDPY